MSFIFSRALVEASLPGSCSDTDASAPLSGNPTLKPCLWHDKTMEPSRLSRFGMTCEPLTERRGAELLTSWLEASRVRTSAQPEKAKGLTAPKAACGRTWPASLAKYDPDTCTWRTAQFSLLAGLDEFLETWPRWGSMRNGECWERSTLVPRTSESAYGLWPTPCATDSSDRAMSARVHETKNGTYKHIGENGTLSQVRLSQVVKHRTWPTPTVCGNYNRKGASATSGDGLATVVAQRIWPTATATATATAYKGWSPNHNRANTDDRLDYSVERESFALGQKTPPMRLNPAWVEWLMGWPIEHTALKPLATDKFREWRQQHGDC